jgi:hypothetical protein
MIPSRERKAARQKGQAMVETILVLFFFLIAFFLVFQFADNLRARLLCDYAAGCVARARTVGLNDFMLLKTARIATLPAAGVCTVKTPSGAPLSTQNLINRSGDYLACTYEAQAQRVLDFSFWQSGRTQVSCPLAGDLLTASVTQRRPQFFPLTLPWLTGRVDPASDSAEAVLTGTSSLEAHYPDWID